MEPTSLKDRYKLSEDALFEEDNAQDEGMTDEELKIEALKIATNIAKLMSNVTPEDIVNIAETVAKFIKGGDTSADLENAETPEETAEEGEEAEDFEEGSDDEEVSGEEDFEV